jgi:hypothetical protein
MIQSIFRLKVNHFSEQLPLIVPRRDAVEGRVFIQKSDSLRKVGEKVWRNIQIFFQNDGVLGLRVDVEDGRERGFVVLRDARVLQTDWRVLDASQTKQSGTIQ